MQQKQATAGMSSMYTPVQVYLACVADDEGVYSPLRCQQGSALAHHSSPVGLKQRLQAVPALRCTPLGDLHVDVITLHACARLRALALSTLQTPCMQQDTDTCQLGMSPCPLSVMGQLAPGQIWETTALSLVPGIDWHG